MRMVLRDLALVYTNKGPLSQNVHRRLAGHEHLTLIYRAWAPYAHIQEPHVIIYRDGQSLKEGLEIDQGGDTGCFPIYTYVYIYALKFKMCSKISKTEKYFWTCSYVQKTTLNLIKALRVSIYNSKHPNNTKIPFRIAHSKTNNFRKIENQKLCVLCWSWWHY